MINSRIKEIRAFFQANANPEIVKKYSRYFKGGYDGYGIEQKVFEKQKDQWIEEWKHEMTINDYLDLGDVIMQEGKYEEKSLAITFLQAERENYTKDTFDRIGKWFDYGIEDWATTDVLCWLVLVHFLNDEVLDLDYLMTWSKADSEWQRRCVPVTLVELAKKDLKPETAIYAVESLMLDKSEYVQKGIGTLLRGLWKKYPDEIEEFLLKWKDQCGRLIVQYTTEKMDKEYRKKFRKTKSR